MVCCPWYISRPTPQRDRTPRLALFLYHYHHPTLTMSLRNLLLCSMAALAAGKQKQRRATPDAFELYAYGEGIGGLPVFYSDGTCLPNKSISPTDFTGFAYIGNVSQANRTDAAPVTCQSFGMRQ